MARSFPQPEVQPRPDSVGYVRPDVSPSDFGADIARGLGKLGEVAADYAVRERQKADAFAAADLDMRYAKEVGDLLYNPQSGYLLRQGRDALDNGDALNKLNQIYTKYEGLAQNDDQRRAFVVRARARAEAWNNEINRHAGMERRKWYESVASGTAKLSVDEVSRNYDKPDEVDRLVKSAKPILMLQWLESMSPEEAQARWSLFESEALSHAVNSYIAADRVTEGAAYFAQVKDRLGANAPALEAKLKVATDKVKNEILSTEAWQRVSVEATDAQTGRFNPDLARAALIELYPPEVRARIDQQIEKSIGETVRQQNVEDDQKLARLTIGILRTGRLNVTSDDYTKLDDVGRARAESALDVHTRIKSSDAKAERYQKMINRIGLNRFSSIADPTVQAAMTDEQLIGLQEGMDEEGFTKLQKARADAQRAVRKGQEVTLGAFNDRVAKVYGEIKKRYGENRAMKFSEMMNAWYHAQPDGKEPTETEVSKKLGESLLVMEGDSFFPSWVIANRPAFMGTKPGAKPAPLEDQIFEEAKALLQGQAAAKNDPYAEKRKMLRPGEVLIRRNGQLRAAQPSAVLPTDERL